MTSSDNGTPAAAALQLNVAAPPPPLPLEIARRNLRIVVLFAIVDGMDVALLPATFRALEAAFALSTSNLATIAAAQGFGLAFGAPFWGVLADNGVSLKLLMAVGSLSWCSILIVLSLTSSFPIMVFLRFVNGCCLSMYAPVIQSIVAESTEPNERGTEFGRIEFWRHCLGNFGAMLVCTSMSNRVIFGMMGWRVAFLSVAFFAMGLTAIILSFFKEQPREWKPDQISILPELRRLYSFLCIGSYRIVILQGMFQEMSFGAMQFLAMYFQYLGLPDAQAGFAAAMYQFSRGLGYFGGGTIGDVLAKWSPHHGRTFAAQLSCILSLPLVWLLFHVIGDNVPAIVVVVFTLGLVSVWPKTACNKPILIDVVPDGCIASATAWDRTIEGGVGHTVGPHAMALICTVVYGYNPTDVQVSDLTVADQMTNMRALASSLFLVVCLCKSSCCLIYCLLHHTYKQDLMTADNKYSASLRDGKLPTEATPFNKEKNAKEV